MDYKALIKRLRDISMQTGSLCCFGCGYEHNCSIHGCAVLKEAAAALCALTDEVFGLKAELETARAERDAAIDDLSGQCEYCAKNDDCISRKGPHYDCWQWRGIKGKETSNDKV